MSEGESQNGVETTKGYSSIADPNLKELLERVDTSIARDGFSDYEPATASEARRLLEEMGMRRDDLHKVFSRVRANNIITLVRTPGAHKDKLSVKPDGIRALAAYAYTIEKRRTHHSRIPWNRVNMEQATRRALGNHPLAEQIKNPEAITSSPKPVKYRF